MELTTMHPFEYYVISFPLIIVSTTVLLIQCFMPLAKLSCKRMSSRIMVKNSMHSYRNHIILQLFQGPVEK